MQPGPNQPPAIQDSVVGRDMHTGNVIHNHYHLPPSPQPAALPAVVVYEQTPQAPMPTIQRLEYKEIGADWWIFNGIVCGLSSAFIPFLVMISGAISLLGVLLLAMNINIGKKQPGHPDSDTVSTALLVNIISLLCVPFGIFVGWNLF